MTSDAGALLRFVDLYARLEGGNLNLLRALPGRYERWRGDSQ